MVISLLKKYKEMEKIKLHGGENIWLYVSFCHKIYNIQILYSPLMLKNRLHITALM